MKAMCFLVANTQTPFMHNDEHHNPTLHEHFAHSEIVKALVLRVMVMQWWPRHA